MEGIKYDEKSQRKEHPRWVGIAVLLDSEEELVFS